MRDPSVQWLRNNTITGVGDSLVYWLSCFVVLWRSRKSEGVTKEKKGIYKTRRFSSWRRFSSPFLWFVFARSSLQRKENGNKRKQNAIHSSHSCRYFPFFFDCPLVLIVVVSSISLIVCRFSLRAMLSFFLCWFPSPDSLVIDYSYFCLSCVSVSFFVK